MDEPKIPTSSIFPLPEIIIGKGRAARARIVQLLVERVDVPTHDIEVRPRPNGLSGLMREVLSSGRAAA